MRESAQEGGHISGRSVPTPLLKEVVALVVHNHERREVLDFNLPHGLHTKLRELKHVHLRAFD